MKKVMIVLTTMVFALTFGAAFAYAGENTPVFSDNNNLGVLLYAEAHPAYKAEIGVTCGNWTSAELFPVQIEHEIPRFSADNNIGVLLYDGTHETAMAASESDGSGAGGVSAETTAGKCKEMKGEWKPFSINELYNIPGVRFMPKFE